jgi:signal transduction histidine kinase
MSAPALARLLGIPGRVRVGAVRLHGAATPAHVSRPHRTTYHRSVESARDERGRLGLLGLDVILVTVALVLTALTLVIIADPSLSFALLDRSLSITLNSLTALGSLVLAALALARYRESGRIAGLFQSSAFLVLAWVSGLNTALVLLKKDAAVGLTLGNQPSEMQLPLYVWSLALLVSASLFAIGGLTALRGPGQVQPSVRRTLLIPVVAMSIVAAVLFPLTDLLPAFVDERGLEQLIAQPSGHGIMTGVTPIAVVVQIIGIGVLLVGTFAYRRSFLRSGPVADSYLAVALLLAAFGELHFALYPVVATVVVTTAGALRLAFFGVLLLGINAESRSDLRALRGAYAGLERLRETEAERATLEERTRLARELHDGLSQDLWFAKLKHSRLLPMVPEEARGLADEVTSALDAAIDEARQAVMTMRTGLDRDRPLHELLSDSLDEFASRSGVRADFSGADLPDSLSPRKQAELLRIVQEALTNVRKHADATVVRLTAEVDDGRLLLGIVDNGRGFRPDETSGDGLGMQGMKERARLMGGEVQVSSEPSGGTTILIALPIAE